MLKIFCLENYLLYYGRLDSKPQCKLIRFNAEIRGILVILFFIIVPHGLKDYT